MVHIIRSAGASVATRELEAGEAVLIDTPDAPRGDDFARLARLLDQHVSDFQAGEQGEGLARLALLMARERMAERGWVDRQTRYRARLSGTQKDGGAA